jgi:uncharacterized protein YabE (DUF348 family)
LLLPFFSIKENAKGGTRTAEIKVAGVRNVVSRERDDFEISKPAKIDVYYGDKKYLTASEMLEKSGIVVFPEDHVEFFPKPSLGLGSKITVLRATEVYVKEDDKVVTMRTWAKTVDDFLDEKEIDFGEHDQLKTQKTLEIKNGMTIQIQRAKESREIERFSLPFKVIVKDDPWLPSGKVKITQQGESGERQIAWKTIRQEGKEVKRILIGDSIASQSKDRIVLRGTKPVSFKGPYYEWIQDASRLYGANADEMYRVMMCESGGDPYAQSPSGKYKGLFQYDKRTWSVSGFGDRDIFDPYAQINAAAKAWKSRYSKWPVTSRVCGDLGR